MGIPAKKVLSVKPIDKRLLLLILLGCVVLILGVWGGSWLFNGKHGSNAALSGKPGSSTPTSGGFPLATATLSITNIAITPNLELSAVPVTETPSATTNGTTTPQTSQTSTPTPTKTALTQLPIRTTASCGSPNTWVVYIVQPGDSLFHISQVYGVTVAELQRANCLGSSTTLHTGQILYVPPWAPIAPTPTTIFVVIPTWTPTDTQVFIQPSDTPTQPAPVDTATDVPPVPTDIPTDIPIDTPGASVSP